MTIQEIALKKQEEYKEAYVQWCRDNPGYIMNGLASKELAARDASYCHTEEDILTLMKVARGKSKDSDGANGWHFYVKAFEEILKEYNDATRN